MIHKTELQKALNYLLKGEVDIFSIKPVGGGSISRAYAISSGSGDFFLKVNTDAHALAMFEAEEDGLKTLKTHSKFVIPAVYGARNIEGTAYLMMDLINSAPRLTSFSQDLGRNLAELHQVKGKSFGYHQDNFIGSLPQSNQHKSNWGEFFISQRMLPMIRLAREQKLVDAGFIKTFESALPKIIAEMPEENPSLVHGDLWSGNLMVDQYGKATIIDPAVYYGHREMDLAFTQMFGGFDNEFYQAYNEAYPMELGFSARIGLYNLYPYLVHLNLFGRSYFGHIEQTIRKFT